MSGGPFALRGDLPDADLRSADLIDADDVAALLCELGYPCDTDDALRRIRAILDNDRQALVVARVDGAVAGLVWWVANLFDKLERQRRESIALRNDAGTDILTGLANRRALDEALTGLLRGQREHDTTFSLLMLDLDHFKTFNDDFGHLAGDQVLRITGHLLRAALRPADMAARYGGEEFVLLLPGTDISGASEVATRLLDAFRGFAWPQRTVTVSIGMAQAVAGDAAEDLIRRADSSLYDAKRGGRDRAVAAIALPQVLRPGAFPRAVPGS